MVNIYLRIFPPSTANIKFSRVRNICVIVV